MSFLNKDTVNAIRVFHEGAKDKITNTKIAKLLQTSPEALEEFEKAYEKARLEQPSNDMMQTSSQDAKAKRKKMQAKDMATCPDETIQKIIGELIEQEVLYSKGKNDECETQEYAVLPILEYLSTDKIVWCPFDKEDSAFTYREQDRDLLLAVRSGEFQNENGSYRAEFFDMVNELERRFQYAQKNTSLPKTPNMKLIEEFVVEVNKKAVDF